MAAHFGGHCRATINCAVGEEAAFAPCSEPLGAQRGGAEEMSQLSLCHVKGWQSGERHRSPCPCEILPVPRPSVSQSFEVDVPLSSHSVILQEVKMGVLAIKLLLFDHMNRTRKVHFFRKENSKQVVKTEQKCRSLYSPTVSSIPDTSMVVSGRALSSVLPGS